jgi:shikimate dehydrogenase
VSRRVAVLGHPIAHSLSPVMHRAAYRALGLHGWRYDAVDVEVDDLAGFVATMGPDWVGLSITMPHKRAIGAHLAWQSELSRQVGAVNTVVCADDGLRGYNTDVHGIAAALGEALDAAGRVDRGVVLGGGATAASTLAALASLGCTDPLVLVRSPERATHLIEAAERLGTRATLLPLDDATLGAQLTALPPGSVVVSTLPADAADPFVEVMVATVFGSRPPARPVLLDVAYHPWPSRLAAAWERAGGAAVSGLSMLVHQAEGQVRLLTGRPAPLDVMRAAVRQELDRRATADRDRSRADLRSPTPPA